MAGVRARVSSSLSSRLSSWLVAPAPFAWITLFLFVPYCLLFCYSFWSLMQTSRYRTR